MKPRSPSYSFTMRLRYPDEPGTLGRLTSLIGDLEGQIGAVDIVQVDEESITRDMTVGASDVAHGESIIEEVRRMSGVEVINVSDRTFLLHLGGKIEMRSKVPVKTRDDLSMVYTPGVARVCRAIADDPEASFNLTIRRNTVAVVTDGSAVLGMGNIGARAALPVMEGKALLFKEFGGVDAFPICLETQDADEIVSIVRNIAPTFGGINLEDISAPRCIAIEEQLKQQLEIPVFHDDQHGTAIVVLAALRNALKVVGKEMQSIRVAINGAGAAGSATTRLLLSLGVRHMLLCDRSGILVAGRDESMDPSKQWLAEHTNPDKVTGTIHDAVAGADVFIGVSVGNVLTAEDVQRMNSDPVVFALANPIPEIMPEEAHLHARVMATGRSDYPNQINNVLCFPGLFRGMLDVGASDVTDSIKLAAAEAIAGVITENELRPGYIIPSVFDRRVAQAVADRVSRAAAEAGVARRRPKAATHPTSASASTSS